MNKKEVEKNIEEIIELARETKIAEEEIIKQSIEEKNKLIEELRQANKELNKQILYLKAEFENYRKRVEKEKQQKFILGKIDVFEKIISFYEMLNYALDNLEKIEKENKDDYLLKVVEGIKLLSKEFENFLNKEGIKKIECINQTFNPAYHEVVEIEEVTDEESDNKIISIISNGYLWLGDDIEYTIKPAKVKIAKFKQKEENKNIETKEQKDTSN